jgi:hypothetical protein
MAKPKAPQAKRPSSKKRGHKSLQIINPVVEGTFDFLCKSKRKHNATFSKDKRFKVDIEHARVPSPQHYNLKRVWSANRIDHFCKQVSTLPTGSIYY